MDIRSNHVAIYIRWSTEDQGEGTTLEVQLEGCKHYVLSQGWRVNDALIFVDDGYSGGTLKRPAITALRKKVRAGEVDCVVVFKLDRLSRSVLDTVNLVLDEWEGRCYVKSAREPIDTTTPAGKLFFYMLLSYAEWERSVIKDRTFSGKVRRAREGKVPGNYPYGFRLGDKPGSLVVVPEEAAVVRRIFELYDQGEGLLPVVRRLNAEGIPSPSKQQWQRSSVLYILKNPLYKGEVAFLRVSRNSKRERDPNQPYYIKNKEAVRAPAVDLPRLIDPGMFNRVQARLTNRRRSVVPPRVLDSDHLLTGLLRCKCGASMSGARPRGYLYYVCSNLRERGAEACDTSWARQDLVDPVVIEEVMKRYGSPEKRIAFLREFVEAERARQDGAREELKSLQDRLKSLEDQMARVNRAFRTGELPLDLYKENRADLDTERADLLRRMEARALEAEAAVTVEEELRELERDFRALDQWNTLQRRVQKEILRRLLERVRVWRLRGTRELNVELFWRQTGGPDRPSADTSWEEANTTEELDHH